MATANTTSGQLGTTQGEVNTLQGQVSTLQQQEQTLSNNMILSSSCFLCDVSAVEASVLNDVWRTKVDISMYVTQVQAECAGARTGATRRPHGNSSGEHAPKSAPNTSKNACKAAPGKEEPCVACQLPSSHAASHLGAMIWADCPAVGHASVREIPCYVAQVLVHVPRCVVCGACPLMHACST